MKPGARWKIALRAAQVAITVLLIGVLLRTVQLDELRLLSSGFRWQYALLSCALVLGSHLINVLRWQYLLRPAHVPYMRLLSMYGAGLFSNNFLPTGIGGDGVRVALLSREVALPSALFSVSLDRILGLSGLSALLVPALWAGLPPGLDLARDWVAAPAGLWLLLPTAVAGLALLAGLAFWHRARLRALARALLSRFKAPANYFRRPPREWVALLGTAYLLSVGSQALLAVTHWSVLQALSLDISAGAALWLLLLVSGALLLPISVNGLGLQEGIYVVILSHYLVAQTPALGVALLIRLLMVGFSLLGGLLALGWQPAVSSAGAHPWQRMAPESKE